MYDIYQMNEELVIYATKDSTIKDLIIEADQMIGQPNKVVSRLKIYWIKIVK